MYALQMARSFSQQLAFSEDDVCSMVKWPLQLPSNVNELEYVESVHNVLDVYLWLR